MIREELKKELHELKLRLDRVNSVIEKFGYLKAEYEKEIIKIQDKLIKLSEVE